MKSVKRDENKRVKAENNVESLRAVMINLHAVLLSEYGISILLTGNHWVNGGNQGDNGEGGASLPFTS